jgi:hypothetical protein
LRQKEGTLKLKTLVKSVSIVRDALVLFEEKGVNIDRKIDTATQTSSLAILSDILAMLNKPGQISPLLEIDSSRVIKSLSSSQKRNIKVLKRS